MIGLHLADSAPSPTATSLHAAEPGAIAGKWKPDEAQRILERGDPASVFMTVDRLESVGYRVHAEGFGQFLVQDDGHRIDCELPAGPAWRWHRLLFAQVLPLAASLRGRELFHASCVNLRGRGVAVVARSGTGKTSLAVHLVSRGAQLLTDDVLALEPQDGDVWAHPGVGMVNVAAEQLAAIHGMLEGSGFGDELGRSGKVHIAVELPAGPVPLETLYFLARGPHVAELAFEPMAPPDPRELLGATFMPHVLTPTRLTAQLDVCHRVAERVNVFNLRVPDDVGAAALAAAVEGHALSLGAETPSSEAWSGAQGCCAPPAVHP